MKTTFASRIFIGYFVIVALALWFLISSLLQDFKPIVRQSVENTLVETANVLAELLVDQVKEESVDASFKNARMNLKRRNVNANIWNVDKSKLSLNFYVTNAKGIVLFDSEGKFQGQDFSQWRDVYLTLRGKYGARSTLSDPNDTFSSVMHVAAPVIDGEDIIGVVTVYTPNVSFQPFIDNRQSVTLQKGILLLVLALFVGAIISWWLSKSVSKLIQYAESVKNGKPVSPPKLGAGELNQLVNALESMRQELEGKHYVEQYVEQLTHELKSPVAAIKGAAEILANDFDNHPHSKFISNIEEQSNRIHSTIEQMLALATIEKTENLSKQSDVNIAALIKDVALRKQLRADTKSCRIEVSVDAELCNVKGDERLLNIALENLVDNAIDFAEQDTIVQLKLTRDQHNCSFCVENVGLHIPEYAANKIFDRFYSLPRPNGGSKSSGLGLSFVKEIAKLHAGSIRLENQEQGVCATFNIPLAL